ncbi:hypothetical protein G9A89_003292 [Geosiphon pyriformis]|nr:hypothetical protein G9A89_003292 [Geosiphon pyriformis]
MSRTGAKKRSTRVPTSDSVSSSSSHKVKKSPDGTKLLSNGVALKGNTDGKASEGKGVSNSKMNTPQAKHFNNSAIVGSLLSSINFDIEEKEEVSLPPCKSFSLDKAWIDPKIIKTQVKMAVKKSFALDINLSAVEEKLAIAKTHAIRKLFSRINGFGGATTPSKFEGIIRSTFTSEASMEKATSLARENDIIVNSNLKKQKIRSDRAVVIKKIPMNTPKNMIVAAVSEFGKIKSIKIQLISMWQKAVVEFAKLEQAEQLASKWFFLIGKDSVRVAKAVGDRETWAFRDQFRALLFTLPVGMTAHDLGTFLEGAGGKTCVINYSLETGNKTCCAVVCFESDEAMESAFCTEPIFGSYRKFGHSALKCDAKVVSASQSPKSFKRPANLDTRLQLAKLYAKKKVLISRPAQVVSVASVSHGSHDGSGFGSLFFGASSSDSTPPPLSMVNSPLGTRLTHLERSVELLSDQITNILLRLNNLSLVPSAPPSSMIPSVGTSHPSVSDSLMVDDSDLGFNMVLNIPLIQPISLFSGNNNSQLGLSSSKVLTSKIGILESKLVALNASIGSILVKLEQMYAGLGPLKDIICWHKEMNNMISIVTETKLKDGICSWIMNKFVGIWVFTSGLNSGHMDSGVTIIMNDFLAQHVCKVSDIPGQFFSIKLLFKNKLSVSVLGLYAESSLAVCFSQADDINSLVVRAVNESSFIILGGDFNKDGSHKSASFRKCFDLGLVNFLSGSLFGKEATWANSRGVAKIIDYVFVSSSLINTILDHNVSGVEEYFDTDHKAVSVSMGLGGLLDVQLNTLRKQVNKDHWKYNFVNAGDAEWIKFKEDMSANAAMFHDEFYAAKISLDLDTMWDHLCQVVCLLAENVFKKKWFKGFDSVYNKISSRFHKLELLVSKIVKASCLVSHKEFVSLLDTWKGIDPANTSVVDSLFLSGSHFDTIRSALAKIRKFYHSSKLSESNCAKKSQIKLAINKRIESFELNKGHTVRSVLKQPFRKMVLDHLVVEDKLVLDSAPVKSKVDEIMEDWTRKQKVVLNINDEWFCQYRPLGYVFDKAFSGVMGLINFDKLFRIVSNLPDGKAAGLSGISNELWKHCDILVFNMLLVFLNFCLSEESVPGPWREAWVSIIPKPYEWEGVLTNTHLIALIETARKILSKILSNRISSAAALIMSFVFPIFAVGSVVENALEKNRELWLKCLVRIKMCNRFIRFFGGIYKDRTNQVITDFGLTDGYWVHDSLDQGEKSMCEYRLISHFVSKSSCVKSQVGLFFCFAAGAFVDNMIWVGNSQSTTQHILNVASEFFQINDILINNDKTVAISINYRVRNSTLFISSSPISVAKKDESHWYLDIFLSTEGFSRPSLAKAYSDICFFTNLVLKKAISDNQFLYLVSVVLQPIISYRTQFSFVPIGICNKWDAMIHKGLNSIHHPFFYDLKSFLQIQSENKVASLINFANSGGIVGRLFSHRSHNLQVLCWHPIHLLSSPVRIHVSASNNFLADVVRVLYNCKLSLGGSFANSFHVNSGMPMLTVLGESVFSRCLPSLQWYGVAFKKLDPHGPIPEWFRLSAVFLAGENSSPACIPVLANMGPLDILGSSGFVSICDHLSQVNARVLSVYTDGSLRNLGTVGCKVGAAAFFKDIGMGLGVGVSGLMSSTMAELQAIVLALECVSVFSNVHLFSDSQSTLDACKSELGMCQHIANVISSKVLNVAWHKVKGHSGVLGNEHADVIASADSVSDWFFSLYLDEHFLMADGNIVSDNSRHFVYDTFHAMCHACWEVGSGSKFLPDNLRTDINWSRSSLVWHFDLHMATSFTSRILANTHSYFMKALHHRLPVAVRKWLYNRLYLSVLCLYCGDVEVSDHVFSCEVDDSARCRLLDSHMDTWKTLSGSSVSFSCLLQLLSSCVLGSLVSMALHKGFVFDNWFCEAVSVFHSPKMACLKVVNFTCFLGLAFRDEIWLVCAKHRAYMKKHGLILLNDSSPTLVSSLTSHLFTDVIDLLGINKAFGVYFGFRKSYMFFSSIGNSVSVYIAV